MAPKYAISAIPGRKSFAPAQFALNMGYHKQQINIQIFSRKERGVAYKFPDKIKNINCSKKQLRIFLWKFTGFILL